MDKEFEFRTVAHDPLEIPTILGFKCISSQPKYERVPYEGNTQRISHQETTFIRENQYKFYHTLDLLFDIKSIKEAKAALHRWKGDIERKQQNIKDLTEILKEFE